MKAYTTIEQSKELAKILTIETADMSFRYNGSSGTYYADLAAFTDYWVVPKYVNPDSLPCWSLAALLGVLPSFTFDSSDDKYYRLHCMERYTEWYDNLVDACVEMIKHLKENNLI